MFNNPFLKKDPLLEAVKTAQADGEMRRQAEAIVNEEFGVYSRKAVVREDLAAYDAALDEVYAALKEGKKVDQDKDTWLPKNYAGGKESIRDRISKSNATVSSAIDTSHLVKGRKKHMEEGKGDGNLANNYPPYDKVTRGDVIAGATGKDQMGGKKKVNEKKMWEGSGVSGEDPGMEVAKQAGAAQQAQTPTKTPTKTGNAAGSTISNARSAAGMNEAQLDELTGKGKLPQMKANYQDAKKIHSNEADWHAARADRAERRGESKKAEHHMDAGYGHEEKAERAGSKLKRANALMTRAKAVSDIKSSKVASKSARAEYKEEAMMESILAKLAAKHMKEDSSFRTAQLSGKPVLREKNFSDFVANLGAGNFGAALSNLGKSGLTGLRMANRARLSAVNAFNPDIAKQAGYRSDVDSPATPEAKKKIDTAIEKSSPGKTLPARDYSKDNQPPATTEPAKQSEPATTTPADKPTMAQPEAKTQAPGPATTPAAKPSETPAAKPSATPATASKPAAAPKVSAAPAKSSYFRGSPNVTKGDYTIRKGDTLSAIAKAKGTSVGAIQSMNKGLTDVNKIAAAGKLNLPTSMKNPSSGSSSGSSTGPEFPKSKPTSVPTPPSRPQSGPPAPADKPEPVTPSSPATPTGGSPAMKPDYHRTTLPGNRTGDVTPTGGANISSNAGKPAAVPGASSGDVTPRDKPTAMSPDVGRRSSSPDTNGPSISVAPEKSSATPPEEKKKAPTPPPAPTTAVEHRLSESVVTVGANKYRIV